MEPTQAYLFTAWFRDASLAPDDQDHEWPACFEVLAATADLAEAWGSHLVQEHAASQPHLTALSCSVEELPAGPSGQLPLVPYGVEATAGEIGW